MDTIQSFIEAEEEILIDPESIQIEQIDEKLVNAYIKQLQKLENRIKSTNEFADLEIDKINKIREQIVSECEIKKEKFINILELFLIQLRNKTNGKEKSYKGFYGTIGLRKTPDKLNKLEEDEKIIDEILGLRLPNEQSQTLVKIKYLRNIDAKALKEFLQNNKLQTVEILPGEEKFYLKEN